MKRLILFVFCLMFTSLSIFEAVRAVAREPLPIIAEWAPPEPAWEEDTLPLRWQLLRWYNLNLTAGIPEEDFRESYWNLIPGEKGLLGWLEFGNGVLVPVYADGVQPVEGQAFLHSRDTAFPIGYGGECVLTWRGESADAAALMEALGLESGSMIEVCILDCAFSYRVEPAGHKYPEGPRLVLIFPGVSGEEAAVCCVYLEDGWETGK